MGQGDGVVADQKRKIVGRIVALIALCAVLAFVFFDRLDQRDFPRVETTANLSCSRSDSVMSLAYANLHDAVYLEGQTGDVFNHYLLLANEPGRAVLLGSDRLSTDPMDWTTVSDRYAVHDYYESDDAISVDGRHYLFEEGQIFELVGDPAEGSGHWKVVGTYPDETDDVGVFFDGETLHLLGEYGKFPHGFDGTSIAYFTGDLTFERWDVVDLAIAEPTGILPSKWGLGDATVAVADEGILLITDIESQDIPYHLALWIASSWGEPFRFAGIIAAPMGGTNELDNHRVQDGEVVPTEDGGFVLFANWRDIDGISRQNVPVMPDGTTRFVGSYMCD